MTHTTRADYPRAVNRDRTESKNTAGVNLPKGGAGNHNWGNIDDEIRLEANASYDEEVERAEELAELDVGVKVPISTKASSTHSQNVATSTSNVTEEEVDNARELRKDAFQKGDEIDLVTIARTSAAMNVEHHKDIYYRPGEDDNDDELESRVRN